MPLGRRQPARAQTHRGLNHNERHFNPPIASQTGSGAALTPECTSAASDLKMIAAIAANAPDTFSSGDESILKKICDQVGGIWIEYCPTRLCSLPSVSSAVPFGPYPAIYE